jgi:hypothetical protein
MSIQGSVNASVSLLNSGISDSEQSNISIAAGLAASFVDGTGAGAINAMWQDIRPLADGANEPLDVVPAPTSGISGSVTFARLKVAVFWAPSTNTTNITVVRHASTGVAVFTLAGAGVVLKPGGFFAFVDPSATGVPVAAGTDIFTVTNSAGAAATYGVVFAGALT